MIFFSHIRILAFCLLSVTAITSVLAQHPIDQSGEIGKSGNVQAYRQPFRDSIPKPHGYVNDYENIYTDREEAVLDSLIRAFENKTTIQMAVITFDTTMTTRDGLDVLTVRIANVWGVGQKDKNNGVVIGISRGYRRITIRNGSGIEKILTNEETKQIIDGFIIPEFRESRYFEGTYNGLVELMRVLGERNE
ncbi:MAG TPA: TPM domain-containing protein [Chitinophagaceae bacterium]|nr:TPM domain-containing protein [Chitinophagaceae bacterium]